MVASGVKEATGAPPHSFAVFVRDYGPLFSLPDTQRRNGFRYDYLRHFVQELANGSENLKAITLQARLFFRQ
jgi:hypothetical protein